MLQINKFAIDCSRQGPNPFLCSQPYLGIHHTSSHSTKKTVVFRQLQCLDWLIMSFSR